MKQILPIATLLVLLQVPATLWGQAMEITASGDVGIGTNTPTSRVHVFNTVDENTSILVQNTNASNTELNLNNAIREWKFRNNRVGNFVINTPGDLGFELMLNDAGDLTIQGELVTAGPSCSAGCDEVFRLGDDLESIEEHAAFMWKQGFLSGIGPTDPHAAINLSTRSGTLLNELEKAHIYIDQLNQEVKALRQQIEEKTTLTEEVLFRLAKLEATVH